MKTASSLVLTAVFVLVLCGAASAAGDNNVALNTTHNGTVSGDLYVNATQPVPFADQPADATSREFNQTFNLPTNSSANGSDIQWAEVYVNIYSGSGSANWPCNATIMLDGNGDGVYETTLGTELLTSDKYSKDGTIFWINDHCFRVYSDYQLWYDVTGKITCTNPSIYVKTQQVGTDTFDGRLKMITLVAAYNDGDSDKVDYWVNDGQDWIGSGTSQTGFETSTVGFSAVDATLNTVALSSKDGSYNFNGETHAGADPVAPVNYFEAHTWNVTSKITPGQNSTLTYTVGSGTFKNVLATLTIREAAVPAPVANFTTDITSGVRPLAVHFTSTSTGVIDSYAWDFTGDGTTDSTEANPTWTYYNAKGTYTVKLKVTGPGGNDTETKTNYITVNPRTWYVDDDGGTGIDYTNIQDAINNAASYDTIHVYPGTYGGFAVPIPYLSIIGESADTVTVNSRIDIPYTADSANATGTVLQGLKITTETPLIGGSGTVSDVVIKDCIFEGLPADLYGVTRTIFENNVIENCTTIFALIAKIGSDFAVIQNNTIKNNSNAAAIVLYNSGNHIVTKNRIESNNIAFWFYNTKTGNLIYLNDVLNNTLITKVSGTVPTVSWSSPDPIAYSYNGKIYKGYMGNYYSDYTGVDANGDGIGDTPYTVPDGLGVDNYPLMAPLSQYDFNAIQANFTATPINGVVPLDVQFNDTSLGNIINSYAWDFNGDGVIESTEKNPIWTYTTVGNYTVKLTVSNGVASDDEVKTDCITVIPDTEVPTVSASPAGGNYTEAKQVTLTATDNAGPYSKIYYTLDGTDPTTSSTLYTDPIRIGGNIGGTTVLKFIAVDYSSNKSPVQTETYNITDTEAPTVTANPVGTNLAATTQVTLTATDNVDPNPAIYYTTNGDEPTTSSTPYTGPININADTTLKFIAADASGHKSPVQTEIYKLVSELSVSGVTVTNYPISQNKATVTVNNTGAVDAGAFNVTVQFNGNNTTVNIPGLVAGGSTTFTVKDTGRHQVGETITVNVMVDPENVISEADEANNGYNTTVTVATVTPASSGLDSVEYAGGRFSSGHDLVNNVIYKEGNIGVRVLEYGGYSSAGGTFTRIWTASDLNIPEGATLLSARLYQARTWWGYPDYTIQFNGHDTQQPIGYYWDRITGQNVFDVAEYFNLYGDNTAIVTGGGAAYASVLVVIYQAASEPYRQIWINEGSDCLIGGNTIDPVVAYTMFDNVTTNGLVSAKVTTVLPSGDAGDSDFMYFNDQVFNCTGGSGSDPGIVYFNVTSGLQNGTNEVGVIGHSYLNFAIGVLEVTKDLTAPTVTVDVKGGLYNASQTVTLNATDNMDTNPKIYFTLNGDTPTTNSTLYTGPISVDKTTVLKFIGVDDVGNVSDVQSEVYTIDTLAPNVSASIGTGVFGTGQNVTLTATDNVDTNPDIYYTTDGTTPTTSSTLYTGSINISATTVLKFFALDDAGNYSPVQTKTYIIDTTAPTVNADVKGGLYNTSKSVVLHADDNVDAHPAIYYTLNGDAPTTSSALYSGTISIAANTMLQFIGVDIFGNVSPVQSETYTFDTIAPTVTADIKGGLYNISKTVTLTAADNLDTNPEIRYTTDGTTPTTASTLYTGPISINSTTTLKFLAVDDAGNTSDVQSETYTIDTVKPIVTKIDPVNSAVINNTGKVITITFSEAVKQGAGLILLKNSKGTSISTKISVNGNKLTITPVKALGNGIYTLQLSNGSVTDTAGNSLAANVSKFTVDTIAPKVSRIDPANKATINNKSKKITVTFSEAIKNGSGWIELLRNGTKVSVKTVISGNKLTIKPTKTLTNGTYQVVLHTGSLTDKAGNKLAPTITKFTVKN